MELSRYFFARDQVISDRRGQLKQTQKKLYLTKLYVIILVCRIHICKVSDKSKKFIFGSSVRATFPTMTTQVHMEQREWKRSFSG